MPSICVGNIRIGLNIEHKTYPLIHQTLLVNLMYSIGNPGGSWSARRFNSFRYGRHTNTHGLHNNSAVLRYANGNHGKLTVKCVRRMDPRYYYENRHSPEGSQDNLYVFTEFCSSCFLCCRLNVSIDSYWIIILSNFGLLHNQLSLKRVGAHNRWRAGGNRAFYCASFYRMHNTLDILLQF